MGQSSGWWNFVKSLVLILLHFTYFQHMGQHGVSFASAETILSGVDIVESRELAGLAEKWNLTSDGVDFGGLTFRLNYIISDFIIDSMMGAEAYTIECKEEGVVIPLSDMDYFIEPDETTPGSGDFLRNIAINVTVNPANVETSIVYRDEYDEDGKKEAKVEFCMRFSLYTNGDTPIEVNYLETVVGLTAGLSAGFEIEAVAVAPKDKLITTAIQDFEVDAYQCTDNYEPLAGTALARARNQGEVIRVCVTPNQEARNQGVYMRAIQSFEYNRDYGGPLGMVTQTAIADSAEASPLTVLYCAAGDLVCAFDTVLFANMFMSPGNVAGSGTALLQIGDDPDTRRRLRNLRSQDHQWSRSLQANNNDGVDKASQFDLDFEMVPGEEFNGILKTASSPKTNLLSSFVAMLVIALFHLMFII